MVQSLCENLILAARNNKDGESPWMQLLVIVVFVVIYGVRALAKLKKNNSSSEQQPLLQPAPRKPGPIASAQQRPSGKLERPVSELKKKLVQPSDDLDKLRRHHIEPATPSPLTDIKLGRLEYTEIPTDETEFEAPVQLDFSSTDSLRAAFLYHEIIGKPIAMRKGGLEW